MNFHYETRLAIEHEEEWGKPGGCLLLRAQRVGNLLQVIIPIILMVIHQLGQTVLQCLVGALIQAIGLGVVR